MNLFLMYILTGATLDEYWEIISSPSSYIHIPSLNPEYIVDITTNMNNLLSCDTPETVFSEALLIQTFMTALIATRDNYAPCPDTHSAGSPSGDKLPKHVALAKNIIESRYYEPLSLDELQSQVKINKHQLCRDFTRYLGQPPLKYLNHYRIGKAVNLLLMTDDTVHSIGDTVGIANTTHFINLFKAQMGLTPQQYRNIYSIAFSQIV